MPKKLLKVLLGVLALVVIVVAGILLLVNTDQWKQALQNAVARNTGYELTIAGELDLNLFPVLGLTLNDVRVRNPAFPQELASTSAVSLRVDRNELIGGRLLIEELIADDFHINYLVDANGNSPWLIENRSDPASPDSSGSDEVEAVTIAFERIRIENASIDYQDVSQGSRYQFHNINLESRDTNFSGQAFSLELDLDMVRYDAASAQEKTVSLSLNSRISADLAAGTVLVEEIGFSVTPMLLQGRIAIRNLNESVNLEGAFNSNRFDSIALLQHLGLMTAETEFTGNVTDSPQLELGFEFSGNSDGMDVSSFRVGLGETEIEGDATVRLATAFAPMSISYDVISSALDLSPFIPATEEQADPALPEPTSPEAPLPFDSLTSLSLRGSIAVESVTANEFLFQDVNLFTNIEDGVLDLELQPASVFDGLVQGSVRVDGRGSTPTIDARITTQNLNLVELAPAVSRLNVLTGRLNLNSAYTARGNTVSALGETLAGSTEFSVTENSVNIALIKQVFTAIVALSPSGETIQQWPDVIQFAELGGTVLLEDGLESIQQIALRMDNFDISGSGALDLDAGRFDYDMQFAMLGPPQRQTIPVNERFHNISWPVDCSNEFSAPTSQYCRPDFEQVREIFTDLAAGAVRDRLQQELDNQAPDELRDAARGLLNNLLPN
ncbi:MAG: AsmA family protein [Gammaproteobacteria bacterium]